MNQRLLKVCLVIMTVVLLGLGAHVVHSQSASAPKKNQVPALVAIADPAADGVEESKGISFLKGGNYPVRNRTEEEFTESTKMIPYEVFRDEDFGNTAYVTHGGNLAVVPTRDRFEMRSFGSNGLFEAIRFSPLTGVAWRLNDLDWEEIPEVDDELPGAGSYDIQIVHTGDDGMVVLRLDKRDGRVWALVDDIWKLTETIE